jgi:putative hydrolase of the HAD superfamily
MSKITAVVFDLDDTLYSEREYAFSGFAAVAAAFEDPLGDPRKATTRMCQLFDTEHRRRVFNTMLTEWGLPDDDQLVGRMIETYRSHRPEISLYPDAVAALRRLRGGCRLGLISDGPLVMQSAKIEALGLSDKVDAIILTAGLGTGFGKPHVRAFETMAERLGVGPADCMYVADNATKDFIAPHALGWTTVQIVRSDGVYRDQPAADGGVPQHIIDTLDDLDTILS